MQAASRSTRLVEALLDVPLLDEIYVDRRLDAFQLTNALSAAFFGLLGIWAAVVKRHWFLRLTVVGVVLLASLLIPAYEMVIEFGVQILLIAVAVRIAQHGLRWKWSFSIETALLLMVVFAVTAAIAGQLPEHSWRRWVQIVGSGAFAAYGSLLGLWIVCGKSRWWVRAVVGAIGVLFLIALYFTGHLLQQVAMHSIARWRTTLESALSDSRLSHWIGRAVPPILLGMAIMVAALTLARLSDWFGVAREHEMLQRRSVYWARSGLVAMMLMVAAPLIAILVELTTPPPAPHVSLPAPNGYDNFIAAGRATPNVFEQARQWDSMKWKEQRELFDSFQVVVDKIVAGVELECRVANPYVDRASAEYEETASSLMNASMAMSLRLDYLAKYGSTEQFVNESLLDLRFSQEGSRGGGVYDSDMVYGATPQRLRWKLGDLDASTCRTLARDVAVIDSQREAFGRKVEVQKLIDQRSDWETRLIYLLNEWSGREHNNRAYWDAEPLAELRLLSVAAALQAFTLEHGSPPKDLKELVPQYLAAIPDDPQDSTGQQPLKFVCHGASFTLYCNGDDGDDDGGIDEDAANSVGGDMIFNGPALPSLGAKVKKISSEMYERLILPNLATPQP